MNICVDSGEINCPELPDAIVVLEKGLIFHTTYARFSAFSNLIEHARQIKAIKSVFEGSKGTYVLFEPSKQEEILALFLQMLFCFPPPELLIQRPILLQYLDFSIEYRVFE
jgi:hypothetical protein